MNRLISRAAPALPLVQRVRTAATGRNWFTGSWLPLLCALAATTFAHATVTPTTTTATATATTAPSDPQTDLMTVVEPKYERDPTSLGPLGDDFNPTNGTITFSATDISIPGNFAIPVELRRWVPSDDSNTGGPPGWKWNIPFIRGNFLDLKTGHIDTGWDWGRPAELWRDGKNCTGSAATVITDQGDAVAGNAYWQGKLLHIPGVTSETFLTTGSNDEVQVTKSHFKIVGCIDNNPPDAQGIVQQGIVVRGPDGTTYTFNQIKTYYNGKAQPKDPIVRTRLLMISSIKDRFNNEVIYEYDAAGNLSRISASDGREINITYQNGEAYQASAHGRTWTYGLDSVTLPDGRQWSYTGLSALAFKPNGIGGYGQQVKLTVIPAIVPSCSVIDGDYIVTINSPDGLQTSYTFRDTIHYRSQVEPDLYADRYQDYSLSRALYCTITRSLVSKTSSGPGVGPYTWNYTYSGNRGTYTETSIPRSYLTGPFDLPAPVGGYPAPIVAGGGAENYRSVTVSGPDKRTVFYIDRRYQSLSEERVVAQDTLNAAGTQLLERSESSFERGALVGMHWYMCPCSGNYPPVNENQLSFHINQTQERKIRYVNNIADATFTTAYADFDERGRPKTVTRSGSAASASRTERIVYDQDNVTLGVMGQVLSISVDGFSQPMEEHTYDPSTAQRKSTTKFGVPQATYEYHGDGNLWKHIDGRGNATTYTDYRRGQPQRIDRADGTFETASINDWGLVTSRTDPNGYVWGYVYDGALRLWEITPPIGWAPTHITYERAAGADYGLPAGYWRQTVDKGNARTVTYFDVLWRPLMVRSYDITNEAGTRKVTVKSFDVGGQLVFESYPQRDLATVAVTSPGRRMQYDALGRATRLEADTENSVSTTVTEYLSGFQTRVTNPRLKITTQSLWALDDPNKAQLATITAPEDVHVSITRNILGNPTSIRRWGSAKGVSADVTRSYVYDSGQRLCKTLEPEVIATMQGYDLAGNVAWRAPGVNLSSNICEAEATIPVAKKISYTYDEVNQLRTVVYGDGSPGIVRTYWNDGLLQTIDSNGAFWSYGYNSLRKPTAEELTYGGKKYTIGWDYDANGNLSSATYPTGGPSFTYQPNAIGEPSQVGSYATNITFHPNGAIAGFTFGNNIVHSMTQTVEGTPKLNSDGSVLRDLYTYDANGNVSTITDQRSNPADGTFSRTMTYDDLDRLAGVSATNVWGSASYLYDPVDNLRSASVGSRVSNLYYGTTNRLDSVVTNGASTGYDYDGNANIWHKGGQTYTFDLGNRLAAANQGGSYAYDGHGRRIKISSNDGTTSIQVYSQGGQLLWGEKTGVATVPATVSYSCSTGTLVGQQCQTTSTYPATANLSCNSGDSLSGSTCTHTSTSTATASYSCPSGGSLSGTNCSRDDSYAASVAYSCNGGDSLSGSACTHTSTYTATASYSCPSGGSLSGTNCNRDDNYAASVAYSCNSGDSLSGSTCTHTSTYTATTSYSCPSGGSLSGSTCSRNDNYAASVYYTCNGTDSLSGSTCTYTAYESASVSYSCPSGYTLSNTTCSKTTSTAATVTYSCGGLGPADASGYCTTASVFASNESDAWFACQSQGDPYGLSLDSVVLVSGKKWTCVYQANRTYSCPNGGSLSGTQCMSTSSQAATATYSCSAGTLTGSQCAVPRTYTANTNYSCPNGGTLSGSTCLKTTTYTATASYSCPSGGSLSGSTCTQTSNYTATSNYSCPSGGTLSGSTCLRTTTYAATASYSCPSGGSLSGSTCTQTSNYTATSNYSCPSGGTLSGSTCLRTTTYAATASYSCPSGGSLSGSTCTQTSTYAATSTYSCNSGDSLSGSTCTHSGSVAATPSYSCPNGGTLSGSQCTGASTTKTAYIYLGGKQIAETVVGGATQYVHTDALGSPVAHTNQAGGELNRTKYEPYGFTAAGTKPGPAAAGLTTTGSAIGFTGHVNDPDTDLVYMQQRYYDPIAGRFLSIDPVTTDANKGTSFNRYAYANNSPYKYADPDGRNPWLLRATYEASYFVATRAGAGILGAMIGAAIYDAIHSDSSQAPKSGDKGDTNQSGTSSGGNSGAKIEEGKQGKHVPGHNNFEPGKSELTHPNPQNLVDEHKGTGQQVGSTPVGEAGSRERVDFGTNIGVYVDPATGQRSPTTNGIIHESKKGVHIVPARPNDESK